MITKEALGAMLEPALLEALISRRHGLWALRPGDPVPFLVETWRQNPGVFDLAKTLDLVFSYGAPQALIRTVPVAPGGVFGWTISEDPGTSVMLSRERLGCPAKKTDVVRRAVRTSLSLTRRCYDDAAHPVRAES